MTTQPEALRLALEARSLYEITGDIKDANTLLINRAALREALEQPEQPSADEIIASHAKRLALELEGVLLECEDTSATSKWWGSAYQAIHNFHDDVDRLYPQDHVSPLGKD